MKEEEIRKEEEEPIIMGAEEVRQLASSKEFESFIVKASKLMIRGLNTEVDVIGSFDRLEFSQKQTIQANKGEKLVEVASFVHPSL